MKRVMKRTMKTITNYLPLLLLAVLASCSHDETDTNGLNIEESIPVSIVSLKQGKGESLTETTGLFSTDDETLLSFKNGGIIERIYVKEGDLVKKGQLLAILNMTEINFYNNKLNKKGKQWDLNPRVRIHSNLSRTP